MFKSNIVLLIAIGVALLCVQMVPQGVTGRPIGVPDPCKSTASVVGGGHCWVICPCGDGPPLNDPSPAPGNATIAVTIHDSFDAPIQHIPAADFWLLGCFDNIALCNSFNSIDATGPTDANGATTIAGAMTAGGCDVGLVVVVQGIILLDPSGCATPLCLDIMTVSPDMDGDLEVDNQDFTQFGNAWEPLGGVYDPCADYDCNGAINSIDFTVFGNHANHTCSCGT